jgi:electron transport complex protein RnfC
MKRFEDAERRNILDCVECGSCSYTCPSNRPLVDFIRLGKAAVIAAKRKGK